MTPQDFVYWLQGFMETADPKSIDERQTQIIKDHLKLVFQKETPDRSIQLQPTPFGPHNPTPWQDQWINPFYYGKLPETIC